MDREGNDGARLDNDAAVVAPDVVAEQTVSQDELSILTQLDALVSRRASWSSALLLLAITGGLFLAFGAARWDGEFVGLLLVVLVFHELGHFFAMRLFGYRNVRMFFIPLFGAAVSGRHFNVSGWKKSLVSLMGPAPGIFLGVAIGIAGIALERPGLIKLALLLEILNVINLLPVLPLDGGWNLHTIVFCRHAMLDLGFRVAAAAALFAASILLGDRIWMFLAIALGAGLPVTYRSARLVDRLRREGRQDAATTLDGIPRETALGIARAVRADFPKHLNAKNAAGIVLNVFETLNSRPPGMLASIALLGLHGVSLAVGGLMSIVLVLAQQGDLGRIAGLAANQPRHSLADDGLEIYNAESAELAGETSTAVATFADDAAARRAFHDLAAGPAGHGKFVRLGHVLIAEGDAGAVQNWAIDWKARGAQVGHGTPDRPACSIRLLFLAPNKAGGQELCGEISEYFANLDVAPALIAPWAPGWSETQNRADYRKARRTRMRFDRAIQDDEAATKAMQDFIRAQVHAEGDDSKLERLRQAVKTHQDQARERAQAALRAEDEATIDLTALDLAIQFDDARRAALANEPEGGPGNLGRKLADRLGSERYEGEQTPSEARRFSANGGSCQNEGLFLSLEWLTFNRIAEGLPALVNWLRAEKCGGIRYDVQLFTEEEIAVESSAER